MGGCQKCFLSALNWLLLMRMNLDIQLSSRLCPMLSMYENCFCKLLVTGKNVFLRLSPSLVKYCLKIDPTAGQICLLLRYGLPEFHVEYFKPKRENDLRALHGRLTPTVWNSSSVYSLKWKPSACFWVLGLDQTSLPVRPGRNDWISNRFGSLQSNPGLLAGEISQNLQLLLGWLTTGACCC